MEDRKSNLLVRRQRLKELLHKEAKQYEEELAQIKNGNRPRLNQLRSVKEVMMKEKMEEQKREAEEKMLQHWKINNPEFREVLYSTAFMLYYVMTVKVNRAFFDEMEIGVNYLNKNLGLSI